MGKNQDDEASHVATTATSSPAPGALSALLLELAQTPDDSRGSAWKGVLRPGLVVGRLELVREIGRGGFGAVWEARDQEHGRSVAFKAVVAGGHALVREEQILREAEVASRLSHPNIVALYDVGRCDYGPYLVLELLRGQSLAERLHQSRLHFREAIRVSVEVVKGVAHAHAQGVVHRDLKPGNIFLCESSAVKVLDFGLAHAFGSRKLAGGTPAFMAPEQWRGAPEDERTDVFALGVILFRIFANELPFPDDGGKTIGKPESAPALEVVGAPALGQLIARMLEKDPVLRPRDAGEVLPALSRVQEEIDKTPSPDTTAPVRMRPPTRTRAAPSRARLRWRLTALGLFLGAVAAGLVLASSPTARLRLSDWVHPSALPSEKSLAVLPFRDVGGGKAGEAFSAGLGEMVANKLRQLEEFKGLRVVSTSEVLRERVASAREARASLGATMALEGSVHWEGDRVTVTANLVDTRTLLVLSARDAQAPRDDAAALLRLVVARVAEMLQLELGPEAGRDLAGSPAPGAYEFYLQGRGYLQRYDRTENLDSAVAVFAQALARDPHSALAYAGQAEAYLRLYDLTKDDHNLEEAQKSGKRAIEIDDRLAPVQMTMGLVEVAAGQYDAAIKSLERALELDPTSADAYRELANAYDAAGRVHDAEVTYRKAIQLRPSDWAAYKDLGVFYNRHGRLKEALPLMQRVVELTPDNYLGYTNLGGIYLRLGRLDEAAKVLEKSLEIRPTADANTNLGTVYYFEQRYSDAAKYYRKATEIHPNDPLLWGNLGDADRWAGATQEAAADYRQAVALLEKQLAVNPRDAEGWSRLAMHLAALGEHEKAMNVIARAMRLDPRSGQVLFRSALVYEEAGEHDRALDAIRSALAAGYSSEEIGKAPPLDKLRHDPRYLSLVQKSQSEPSLKK